MNLTAEAGNGRMVEIFKRPGSIISLMGNDQDLARRVFLEIHSNLPRQGPGNKESTLSALQLAGEPGQFRHILDIGCGPGAQTIDLAEALPSANITAVDLHEPYLTLARHAAETARVADRILFSSGDMTSLTYGNDFFDLIWCEGAAYIMGIPQALNNWKRMLKPGGKIGFTECVFLKQDLPEQIRAWWTDEYPVMRQVAHCLEWIPECGFDLLGSFVLPAEAWWQDYYRPMKLQLESLQRKYAGQREVEAVLAQSRQEIAYHEQYSDCYGYLFIVAELPAGTSQS